MAILAITKTDGFGLSFFGFFDMSAVPVKCVDDSSTDRNEVSPYTAEPEGHVTEERIFPKRRRDDENDAISPLARRLAAFQTGIFAPRYHLDEGRKRNKGKKAKTILEPNSLPSPLPQGMSAGSAAGARLHPIYRSLSFHNGTDFPCPEGRTVASVMDGYVKFSGWMGGYGYIVIVTHRDNLETWYGHLSSRLVANGDRVSEGTPLGRSGRTGNVTGPHLHFEIRCEGIVLDPMEYLRQE